MSKLKAHENKIPLLNDLAYIHFAIQSSMCVRNKRINSITPKNSKYFFFQFSSVLLFGGPYSVSLNRNENKMKQKIKISKWSRCVHGRRQRCFFFSQVSLNEVKLIIIIYEKILSNQRGDNGEDFFFFSFFFNLSNYQISKVNFGGI